MVYFTSFTDVPVARPARLCFAAPKTLGSVLPPDSIIDFHEAASAKFRFYPASSVLAEIHHLEVLSVSLFPAHSKLFQGWLKAGPVRPVLSARRSLLCAGNSETDRT